MTSDYKELKDIPADVLANRVVTLLIGAKGNLNQYASIIQTLIVDMRNEYTGETP